MTTPNGMPSVSPSPRNLGESLQDPSIASTQAAAAGAASSDPAPKVVGQFTNDVMNPASSGKTVGNDQTMLNPVGTQGEQTV